MIKQKEFCANELCPHHKLPMNDDLHYHKEDKGVVATKYGILNTVPYYIKTEETFIEIKYFCEICQRAIDICKDDPVG